MIPEPDSGSVVTQESSIWWAMDESLGPRPAYFMRGAPCLRQDYLPVSDGQDKEARSE